MVYLSYLKAVLRSLNTNCLRRVDGAGIQSHPNSCCIPLSDEVFDNTAPTLPSRVVLSTRLVGSRGSNHLLVAFTAKCFVKQGECEREGGGKDGNIDFALHFRISHMRK